MIDTDGGPSAPQSNPEAPRYRTTAVSRLGTLPERSPGRTILLIGLLLAVAYSASLLVLQKPTPRFVVGDALHYYVYLRSLVYDGDLQFRNDYAALVTGQRDNDGPEWLEPTSTGHVRNYMSIGPAIVWAPLFLVVSGVVAIARFAGSSYPLDGFGAPFQLSAFYSGIAAATAGAWLTFLACTRLFSRRPAIWATLAVWTGSSAIYYSAISPAYSHAASMLAAGAFVYVWVATRGETSAVRYAAVGALGGFAALVRWQDVVFLAVPAVELVMTAFSEPRSGRNRAVRNLFICAATALAVFSPQLIVWQILYGRPIAIPQGASFMRWGSPHVVDVLFSDRHGLFTWTPLAAVAVSGLFWLWRKDRLAGAAMSLVFVLSLYTNAAVSDWWAGEAFGARRFVSCFPIFALGFAALLDRWRDRLQAMITISGVFIALNMLLLLQYQLFMHGLRDVAPYPEGLSGLGWARFVVPFRLIEALWNR